MLRNISYMRPSLKKEIESLVGHSFSLAKRWKMKSVGSPRLLMHEASAEIQKLMDKNADLNYCNVELRTLGIVLRFQSRLETYGLIIPYYRLAFYQNGSSWSFHGEGLYVKAISTLSGKAADKFKMNLLQQKALSAGDNGPLSSLN